MREKIARAIMEHMFPEHNGNAWTFYSERHDKRIMNSYLSSADAVLDAMREPTPEMLDAARDWSLKKYGKGVGNDGATGCYQSMIDAAKETQK